jgi:hypothetical protein
MLTTQKQCDIAAIFVHQPLKRDACINDQIHCCGL